MDQGNEVESPAPLDLNDPNIEVQPAANEAVSAPDKDGEVPPPAVSDGKGAEEPAVEAAAEFTPDFKYKHKDKEFQMDDFWKPLVKDADSQKKVREVLEKVAGFEGHRAERVELKKTVESWAPKVNLVEQVGTLLNTGKVEDVETALEKIGVTDDELFAITKAKLERRKLPPEQRAMLEEKKRLQLENETLLSQTEEYKSRVAQEQATALNFQIDQVLISPDNQKFVSLYEKANGEGSFYDLMIEQGSFLSAQKGATVPPDQVFATIQKRFGGFMPDPVEAHVQHQKKVKVIPRVSGSGASATKQAPTSIEGLRKLAAQKAEQR